MRLTNGQQVMTSPPVFITGSGRCGTTLLRRLIQERTTTVVPAENYAIGRSRELWGWRGDWSTRVRRIVDTMTAAERAWAPIELDSKELLLELDALRGEQRTLANFWHVYHALWAVRHERSDYTRWGDKTPMNVYFLPNLSSLFPEARFILMIRDAYDATLSYGRMPGREGQFVDGAKRWANSNKAILKFAKRHSNSAMILRYEDLASQPDEMIEKVIAFADLDHGVATDVSKLIGDLRIWSHLQNVSGAMTDQHIGKGQREMALDTIEQIGPIVDGLQRKFGYVS